MNPLLQTQDLLAFDRIQAEHIVPAISQLLTNAQSGLEQLCANTEEATWDNTITELERITAPLSRAWTAVGHLLAVVHQPAYREAYNEMLPKVSHFWITLGSRTDLFQRYQSLDAKKSALAVWQQKILADAIQDFTLNGVALAEPQRIQFTELNTTLSEITQKFSENVLDATDSFAFYTDNPADLAGIPEEELALFAHAAEADGKTGWKITLHLPSYLPVMQYANDRSIREHLYKAYSVRASEHAESTAFDNSPHIAEILRLRLAIAHLLDYPSYAEFALQKRMAKTPAEVEGFLHNLVAQVKPFAEKDIAELRQFAQEHHQASVLEPYDIPYFSEKYREHCYAYSEQEVKNYFPEKKVLSGLFTLIEKLYQIRLQPTEAPVWHPSVQVIEVLDANQRIGLLYLDLTARAGKESGAWVNQDRSRWQHATHLDYPIAYLTCNFSPATEALPSTLTHDDVITLFHEMGHALHLLLSKVHEPCASPFASVEWDAIELPSQFMENFCWNYEVLQQLSAHYETQEPLPRTLFEKMLAAKNFQSGMRLARQLEFALTDFAIHLAQQRAFSTEEALQTMRSIRQKVAVVHPPEWHRMLHSFTHIFAGGYAAGYYSYLWAEVLSSDAYALFEEQAVEGNTVIPALGERFKKEILAVGGERTAMDSFVAYRHRPPQTDAFLIHNGLTTSAHSFQ